MLTAAQSTSGAASTRRMCGLSASSERSVWSGEREGLLGPAPGVILAALRLRRSAAAAISLVLPPLKETTYRPVLHLVLPA
ncbi:hypothetical protein AURDEDRAFT_113429 [Auricularia subglabra TFB-10046 SS5]|nr:hypothetical protein AURDEDRAFT_113429 [Auricularia subglabra TFB-10046 SS5]